MREFFTVAFLLISVFSSVIGQNDSVNALISAHRYEDAYLFIKSLDSLEEQQFHAQKCLCLSQLGQNKSAKACYEDLIQRDTANVMALSRLGSLYEVENNLPRAIKNFGKALSLEPKNLYYLKTNGRLALKAEMLREAFSYYSQAYDLNATDVQTIRNLGDIFMANEQYNEADTILNEGLALDSSNVLLLQMTARVKYILKDYQSVVDLLEISRRHVDLEPYHQKMLGFAAIQIDSLDKAIYYLRNLLDRDNNEHTYFYLGLAHKKKGNLEEAAFYLENAIQKSLSPNLSDYYLHLAESYEGLDRKVDLISCYRDAYDKTGESKYLLLLAMESEEYYRDKSIALNYYKRYLKSPENIPERIEYAKQRVRLLQEYLHQIRK